MIESEEKEYVVLCIFLGEMIYKSLKFMSNFIFKKKNPNDNYRSIYKHL